MSGMRKFLDLQLPAIVPGSTLSGKIGLRHLEQSVDFLATTTLRMSPERHLQVSLFSARLSLCEHAWYLLGAWASQTLCEPMPSSDCSLISALSNEAVAR